MYRETEKELNVQGEEIEVHEEEFSVQGEEELDVQEEECTRKRRVRCVGRRV